MSDQRLTELTELTTPADGDFLYVVDVSDTSASPAGTSKKLQNKNARGYPQTSAETTAGVTPTNYEYEPGNVLRYGTNTTPGTTDMTTAIQNAIDSNKKVYIPAGDYLITSALTLATDTFLCGDGKDSVITTSTVDINMITGTSINRATVSDLKLSHTTSTSNGHGILLTNCDDCVVRDCEFTGMSGDGVQGTGGTTRLEVRGCYFHTFTGSIQDSSDINFYNNCTYSIAANNQCHGGNWHGIKFQLTSTHNTATGNVVGTHLAYGIVVTYETTPAKTYNKAVGNTVYDITGDVLIDGTKRGGAGIYGVGGGNVVISDNIVQDTNQDTAVETLTPGGIGLSAMVGSNIVANNNVISCDWYGIAVFSNTSSQVIVTGNSVEDCTKAAIYGKDSSNLSVIGNIIWNDSTSNNAAGVTVLHQTGQCTNIIISDNLIYGDSTNTAGIGNAVSLQECANFTISGNKSQYSTTYGIQVVDCDYGTITGNTVKDSNGSAALRIRECQYVTATGNALEGNSTYSIEIGVSATKVRCENNAMNPAIVNNGVSSGAQIVTTGTAAPVSGTWAQGDIVYDETPSASGAIGWTCTTGGTPGTWKTFGTIAA